MEPLPHPLRRLFDSADGPRHGLLARWLFLRALGIIYFSAFFSLVYQVQGLIGPQGILPAGTYLAAIAQAFPSGHFWHAPTLLWLSSGSSMLTALVWVGLLASVAATLNLWPRVSLLVCFVCFLSFVSAAGDFSGYQSDGMLLEAGFLAMFFSPPGLRPRLAPDHPPIRAALWLLQWEWFRIYFQSGMVKLLSGDPEWRHLTAMIGYYQNSPLPTWIGWYAGHLPRVFQVASAGLTLFIEFFVVLLFFLPRRFAWTRHARLVCFLIVTPWEVGVILTGNYAFLNYLVLALGILLLDDRTLSAPARRVPGLRTRFAIPLASAGVPGTNYIQFLSASETQSRPRRSVTHAAKVSVAAVAFLLVGYVTSAQMLAMVWPAAPLPEAPVALLEPFRIANQYGLFAVMTHGRYEIEFQGSDDGQHWTPYPFRYKADALNQRPGLYAPYQPRFDWNLWFASLGDWRQYDIVPLTEERLLDGSAPVLHLFRSNPFPQHPPRLVRAVLYQYWFTSLDEKRLTGNWWRREELGEYAPTLTREPDGAYGALNDPIPLPTHD